MSEEGGTRMVGTVLTDHSYSPPVLSITVPADELGAPMRTNIPCPQPNCNKIFKQPSALRFHLDRVHKIAEEKQDPQVNSDKETIIHYHCPVQKCIYHATGEGRRKHFSNKKYLRMHYLRVHGEKNFGCTKCKRTFSIQNDLRFHQAECGRTYPCMECPSSFDTWKSYSAHCSGYKHKLQLSLKPQIDDARLSIGPSTNQCRENNLTDSLDTTSNSANTPTKSNLNALKKILPNPSTMIFSMDIVMQPSELENNDQDKTNSEAPLATLVPKGVIYLSDTTPKQAPYVPKVRTKVRKNSVQDLAKTKHMETNTTSCYAESTVCETCSRSCACERENSEATLMKSPRFSASTQTQISKSSRIGAQTQTTGDFILKEAMLSADIPMQRESRGSQVSPRAKLKRPYTNLQTSHTQTTASTQPTKKRRRKKQVQDMAIATIDQTHEITDGFTLSIPDPPWSSVTDTQTQTLVLLDELQASLGESISTQTLESFLHDTSSQDSSVLDPEPPALSDTERTVDQAVLCDLGLLSDSNLLDMNAALSETNPRCGNLPITSTLSSMAGTSQAESPTSFSGLVDSNAGTQTTFADFDFPELLTSSVQTSDFQTSYMHIETQTTNEDEEDHRQESMLDQFLSNMHTQTTDEFLADLSFSDIETQTSSGPLTAQERQTIETQTSLHALGGDTAFSTCGATSSTDMQTQTLFMADTISPDLADSYTQTAFTELEKLMNHFN